MTDARPSAAAVLSAARAKLWPAQSHALLEQVRQRTGYGAGPDRYADAVVMSLWPSRGLWLAAVEVKVSRGDWLRELRDPRKAEAIFKFARFRWLVTSEGVVHPGECPDAWGHAEVNRAGKVQVVRDAPSNDAYPPTLEFIASVMRNAAGQQETVRAEGFTAGVASVDTSKLEEAQKALDETSRELAQVRSALAMAEADRDRAVRDQRELYRLAGVPMDAVTRWDRKSVERTWKIAETLAGVDPERFAAQLESAASALRGIGKDGGK